MNKRREFWERNVRAIVGMLIFSVGINLFIVPADLYNGGVLGMSQLIRTVLVRYLHWFSGTTDIAGVINLVLNIPLFALAFICIGRPFFFRTLVCVFSQNAVFEFDPYPVHAPDPGCTGGQYNRWDFCGSRHRYITASGGSSGGMDIVGMCLTRRYKGISVGKVSLAVNTVIYGICALLFGVQTFVSAYLFGGKHVDDGPDSHPEYQFRSCYFYEKGTHRDH